MRLVTPSMHLVAQTQVNDMAMENMLRALGAPDDWHTDAPSASEELIEVMGRLCYKSFGTEMNANVTKVREGNESYVGNILSTKHGSVLEHATATIVFIDVSPVVTHELVRHRSGTAFSQVSMRFVRLTEIGTYYPTSFEQPFLEQMFMSIRNAEKPPYFSKDEVEAEARAVSAELKDAFIKFVESAEALQLRMAKIGRLDEVGNFNLKKKFTSSMRRLAPYGLATSIGVTANHRAWRFMIEQRTSRHAEEEIRFAFGQVAELLAAACPNIYQDMRGEQVEGFLEYTFVNSKV